MRSRKKVPLNFQETAANCIKGTQNVSHGKKTFLRRLLGIKNTP